jgi:hypothetical protein
VAEEEGPVMTKTGTRNTTCRLHHWYAAAINHVCAWSMVHVYKYNIISKTTVQHYLKNNYVRTYRVPWYHGRVPMVRTCVPVACISSCF